MHRLHIMRFLYAVCFLATIAVLADVPLKGCADVSCPRGYAVDHLGESECVLGGSVIRRIGIAPEVLAIPTDKESTTEVHKFSLTVATLRGTLTAQGSNWIKLRKHMQSYYLGIPPHSNLSNSMYPKGCIIIFQNLFQTLPIAPEIVDRETTDCSSWLQHRCMKGITEYVEDFWAENARQGILPRCQEFATYLEERTSMDEGFHCNMIAGAVNITGMEISGPDAPSELVQDAGLNNGCHPTLPQSYNLLKLADLDLIISEGRALTGPTGGLDGYTPLMSLLLDQPLHSEWICIKTMPDFRGASRGAGQRTLPTTDLLIGVAVFLAMMI